MTTNTVKEQEKGSFLSKVFTVLKLFLQHFTVSLFMLFIFVPIAILVSVGAVVCIIVLPIAFICGFL